MTFDFNLSFDENVADIVATSNQKGKIRKGSDNYLVLLALYNQNYIDNEEGRVERPDGSKIKQTTQRVWDLENKFGVCGIQNQWVKAKRGDYKQYWISRKNSTGLERDDG